MANAVAVQGNRKNRIVGHLDRNLESNSEKSVVLLHASNLLMKLSTREQIERLGKRGKQAIALIESCSLTRADLPDMANAKREIDERTNAETRKYFDEHPDEFRSTDPLREDAPLALLGR